jgi:hypothetical protein
MAGNIDFTDEEVREFTDMDLERERTLKLSHALTGVAKNYRHDMWLKSKQSQAHCSGSVNSDNFPVCSTPFKDCRG